MLVLQDANDTLEVVLAGAITTAQLPCVVTWRDITASAYVPGRSNANTNSTTPVTLVAAPAASAYRVIDHVSVYNADTVNATVTVRIDDNATEYILNRVTIGPAERLEYQEGTGWSVYNSAGAVKTIITGTNNAVSSGLSMTVLASDVTNNNASANTIANVTGLSFPVTSGNKYWFQFVIQYTAAATTTGSRWGISGPGATAMRYRSEYSLTTTSVTTIEGSTAHDLPAASNATSAATAGNIAVIEGFYEASANGDVIARFASEVSNSAIVAKAGSIVQYAQVV
jgi:hypothetical protein